MRLPESVLLVTMGIDVQLRYLAVLVMGWALDAECWVLDWSTIEGDPRDPATLMQFVGSLGDLQFEHSAGDVPLHLVGIDSGFATDCVYRACNAAPRRAGKWVFATKGIGGREGEPIVLPIRDERDVRGRRNLRPLPINTDAGKAELMAMLQTTAPGRGYVHIPKRVGPDFVKQLTAEEQRTKLDADGVVVGTEWKKRTADGRNEALDCAVINLALYHRVRPAQWLDLLLKRYERDEAIERWRAEHPGEQIRGIDTPVPERRPGGWLQRREAR